MFTCFLKFSTRLSLRCWPCLTLHNGSSSSLPVVCRPLTAHVHRSPARSSTMMKGVTCSSQNLPQHFCKDFDDQHCPTTSIFLPLLTISNSIQKCFVSPQEGRTGRKMKKQEIYPLLTYAPSRSLLLFICKTLKSIACTVSVAAPHSLHSPLQPGAITHPPYTF